MLMRPNQYSLFLLIIYCALFAAHLNVSPIQGIQFFGDRTVAAFDLWSFQHLGAGIIFGSLISHVFPGKIQNLGFFTVLFAMIISWEIIEFLMESRYFGAVIADWKKGYEHLANRFIGDFGTVLIGGFIARRYKHAWIYVLPICILWLLSNIFLVENSMIINQLFLDLFT